ncbi:MAG: DUF2721 domain-containing protein [Ignavibacteriales bacterium]|nr:DUF2721 domain-containing protein [Ignavibacteriales bacterium]
MNTITETDSIIQVIQLILAPAVMINACGLLLLSVSNKFSLIINRVRMLNEEKRKLASKTNKSELSQPETERAASILKQIPELMMRAKYLRNSLIAYFSAIGFFVLTSVLIGIDYFSAFLQLRTLILLVFVFALVVFFSGAVFAALDILKGYKVLKYELLLDEE